MKDKTSINRKSNTGAVERETKVHDREGDIMAIATRDVVSIPPSKSIKDTAKVMMEHEFRRLPIADPGSGKLLGIVTVMDILDFFGGGKKFNIIEKKYQDNFLAAINEPVKEIMTRDLITVSNKASIAETIGVMLSNQLGAIPLVDGDGKLAGVVTERDIALSLAGVAGKDIVQDFMSTKVFNTTPGTPLGDACKIMVRNGLRRIPIIGGEADISNAAKKLLGILTSTDVIRFLNAKELFDNLNSNLATDVLETKISDIMAKEPVTVAPNMSIGELCELFAEKNIGGVPVVKDVFTVPETMQLDEVARLMLENGIGSVPVMNDDDEMVGIVSKADFATLAVGIAFEKITVKEIMSKDLTVVSPTERLVHARRQMLESHVGRLPVVEDEGLAGMVTSKDLMRAFIDFRKKVPEKYQKSQIKEVLVEDIMSSNPTFTSKDATIADVARVMIETGYNGLPVVEDDNVVGIITQTDILRLIEKLES